MRRARRFADRARRTASSLVVRTKVSRGVCPAHSSHARARTAPVSARGRTARFRSRPRRSARPVARAPRTRAHAAEHPDAITVHVSDDAIIMPKTARDEPSVAEVQFGDEPSAKKVKDAVSEGDAHPDRHPLKNLARGKSVLELCTYRGDFEPASLQPSKTGEEKTLEYRIAFSHKNSTISPWHDIPYRASPTTYHMMCEIPKWTRAKFEIATKEPGNPIKQDEKKGVLREYKHGDMLFNYGFMPQTWEDPAHVSEDTGFKGDDDPLDMVEIGCRQMKCGQVAEVKVLGVLAMIDDGETDWKVFCIRCDDPLADRIHDVEDVDRELPGLIDTMREWFREYKVAEGKPLNAFALDEKCMDREYTEKIIEETHESWKKSEAALRAISKTAPKDAAAEVSPAAPATAEKTKR